MTAQTSLQRYLSLDAAPRPDGAAEARAAATLADHDARFHPGGYDPSRDHCTLRDRLAKADETDLLPPPIPDGQSALGPSSSPAAQYAAVYALYHNADGTPRHGWMKAPNGSPTNLTERQWVQVRTPAFKSWFGDWEAMGAVGFLSGSPIATARGDEYSGVPVDSLEDAVVEHFRSMNVEQAENAGIGKVRITRSGIHDSIAKGVGRSKIAAFNAVPDIISKGRVVSRERNWKGRGYDTAVIAAPVSIGGRPHVAFAVVRQHVNKDNNFYLHEVGLLEDLKKETERFSDSSLPSGEGKVARPLGSVRSIAQSLFAVNPSSVSKIVDENGEPLVVWHGSESDFTAFDRRRIRRRPDGIRGFYFRDTPDPAEYYGRNRAFFLSIKDPLVDVRGDSALARRPERPNIDATDTKGHDGILALADDSIASNPYLNRGLTLRRIVEIVAFSPTQIKSATDNNGAFSPMEVSTMDSALLRYLNPAIYPTAT